MTARLSSAALLLSALALGASSSAATIDPSRFGKPSYELRFTRDASAQRFASVYPGLATWGYFGAEPAMRAAGKRLPNWQRVTSREWSGTLNVNVDPDYCPGVHTPDVAGGALRLTAYRFSPADVVRCGAGRQWASAYVSSQPTFSQTYGYFEIEAKLPCVPGRWPAFWLLPTAKTPQNGGRLAEVDVFEHYGGPKTLINRLGQPVTFDRVGTPFSSLHYGVIGQEKVATNSNMLPKLSEAQKQAFCAARHSFGVLWTPAEFRFYIDRTETFRTPNPGVDDPHYWVVNMDISPNAGDPTQAPEPSTYEVYAVRAWKADGQ